MRKPLGLLIFISALLLAACGIKSDSYPTNIVTKVSLPQEGNVDRDPAKLGAKLYSEMGCISCHSVDGRDGPGPSFKGLFSKDATVVTDGVKRKVKVDEEYLKRSITDPNADIVAGYGPGRMPKFSLRTAEVEALVSFIKAPVANETNAGFGDGQCCHQ